MEYSQQVITASVLCAVFALMSLTGYHPSIPPKFYGYWKSGVFDFQGNTFLLGIAMVFGIWAGYAAEMDKASKEN